MQSTADPDLDPPRQPHTALSIRSHGFSDVLSGTIASMARRPHAAACRCSVRHASARDCPVGRGERGCRTAPGRPGRAFDGVRAAGGSDRALGEVDVVAVEAAPVVLGVRSHCTTRRSVNDLRTAR